MTFSNRRKHSRAQKWNQTRFHVKRKLSLTATYHVEIYWKSQRVRVCVDVCVYVCGYSVYVWYWPFHVVFFLFHIREDNTHLYLSQMKYNSMLYVQLVKSRNPTGKDCIQFNKTWAFKDNDNDGHNQNHFIWLAIKRYLKHPSHLQSVQTISQCKQNREYKQKQSMHAMRIASNKLRQAM